MIKFRLSKNGHHVQVCHGSESGLVAVAKGNIDCILLDTHLKGSESGFVFLKKLREFDHFGHAESCERIRNTKVVAMTAGDSSYKTIYAEVGVQGFLRKPFDSKDLLKMLDEINFRDSQNTDS